MIDLVAVVATLLSSAMPTVVHKETVERAGSSYDVHYSPLLTLSQKTVGAAAGTRFSQQKCRWEVTVNAERAINSSEAGKPLVKVLDQKRSFGGEAFGDCRQNAAAIRSAQESRHGEVRQILQEMAQADRPHVGIDIDAAHALASN